jgi:Protein of unknown function (DUF3515)
VAHRTSGLYGAGAGRGPGVPAVAVLGALVAALLSGCAGTVRVEPAAEGASSACREVVSRLPGSLSDQPRRGAEGAGIAAWGDPAIVLRCGTEPLGPTTRECVTVDGIDWVVLAQGDDGAAVLATYGRVPGVEVEVPGAYAPAPGVLPALGPAVSELPVERSCL